MTFKVGDEVVKFRSNGFPANPLDTTGCPPIGHVGIVSEVGSDWIEIHNWPVCPHTGLDPDEFRKVQRRNLTEWLAQKTKFEEPKRIGENA